ncbi:SdrD B-like domain-containing protein [Chloroflexota bacterium]
MRKHSLILIGLLVLLLVAGRPVLQAQNVTGGRVCVAAYNDANENNMRDPMEPLLGNVAVYLQNEQTAVVANYVTTGATEPYCFEGLAPGAYFVNFTPYNATPTGPEGFSVTITADQTMPTQFQYGAVPGEEPILPTTPATDSSAASSTDWMMQLVTACCCSSLCMLVFGVIGALVFWMRFRR